MVFTPNVTSKLVALISAQTFAGGDGITDPKCQSVHLTQDNNFAFIEPCLKYGKPDIFNVTFNRNTNLTTLVHANGLPLGVNWTNNAAAGTPAPAYVSLENTGDSNSAVRIRLVSINDKDEFNLDGLLSRDVSIDDSLLLTGRPDVPAFNEPGGIGLGWDPDANSAVTVGDNQRRQSNNDSSSLNEFVLWPINRAIPSGTTSATSAGATASAATGSSISNAGASGSSTSVVSGTRTSGPSSASSSAPSSAPLAASGSSSGSPSSTSSTLSLVPVTAAATGSSSVSSGTAGSSSKLPRGFQI